MTTPSAAAPIADLEDRRWAAVIARDTTALAQLVSDDLAYTHSNGRMDTKSSYLALVPTLDYQSIDRPEREIKVFDDVAIVTGRADITITDKDGTVRQPSIRYTNVWLRRDGVWRFTAWQATPVK